MTEGKASDRDVNRAIRSWLHEDRHEDVSRIAGAVLDQVDTVPQRRARWWPAWRTPTMNKLFTYGLGAAAVLVVALVGFQLLGSNVAAPPGTPTATARPSTAGPTPSDGDLPVGSSHVLWDDQTGAAPDLGMKVTVTIPASGWSVGTEEGSLIKNGTAAAPEGASVTVFARTNDLFVGQGDIYVYGDPCHWASTKPDTPVKTVDEAIAALSAQPSREASAPVDVSYDGYDGKYIALHVPDDVVITDCDEGEFRTLLQSGHALSHEDAGQSDLLTVLDVNGQVVIFDASYFEGTEGTPESVIDEMASIVTSANLDYSP